MHGSAYLLAQSSSPGVLVAEVVIGVIFAILLYQFSVRFKRQTGNAPWHFPPALWAVLGLIFGLLGAILYLIAWATSRKTPAPGATGYGGPQGYGAEPYGAQPGYPPQPGYGTPPGYGGQPGRYPEPGGYAPPGGYPPPDPGSGFPEPTESFPQRTGGYPQPSSGGFPQPAGGFQPPPGAAPRGGPSDDAGEGWGERVD